MNTVPIPSLICRPCRTEFESASLSNQRRCPQCGGPLLSNAQIQKYQDDTRKALDRLRNHSALFMILGGGIMLAVQIFAQNLGSKDAHSFATATLLVCACSIIGGILWWATKQKLWLLLGCVILQLGAILFYFVASAILPEAFQKIGFTLGLRFIMVISATPLTFAFLSWHSYRGYQQIMSTEKHLR